MDSLFYIVSGIVAIGLFVLIARNLYIMDKKEREQMEADAGEKLPPVAAAPAPVDPQATGG